jgi:hypothetical protein
MPPLVYLSRRELRELFNRQDFAGKLRRGLIRERLLASSPPFAGSDFPNGTLSERVAYIDGSGQQCAIIHRFKLPDGKLGASGLPDPKELLLDGTLYKADPDDRG